MEEPQEPLQVISQANRMLVQSVVLFGIGLCGLVGAILRGLDPRLLPLLGGTTLVFFVLAVVFCLVVPNRMRRSAAELPAEAVEIGPLGDLRSFAFTSLLFAGLVTYGVLASRGNLVATPLGAGLGVIVGQIWLRAWQRRNGEELLATANTGWGADSDFYVRRLPRSDGGQR